MFPVDFVLSRSPLLFHTNSEYRQAFAYELPLYSQKVAVT